MKKSQLLVCFLALFGCSLAQTITQLTSGTASVGALAPVLTDYEADRQANYYKIWIPGNVKSVKLDLEKTDTACSYIDYYVSSSKIPCNGDFTDPTDFSYVCKSAYYGYVSTTTTQTFIPGDSDSHEIGFATEDWLYVTVARYASKEDACAYSLTLTLDLCPDNNVAFYESSAATCLPLDWSLTTAQLPYTATVNLSVEVTQNRVWVPKGASAVRIQVINATDYIYVTGANRHAVTGSSYYNCRDSGGPLSDPIDLWCHFPEEGWFYYSFEFYYTYSAGESIGFIATVDTVVCDDMHAGYNCSFPLAATSTITAGQTVSLVAAAGGLSSEQYPSHFFYFDNVNGTSVATNFTVSVTAGSVYIVYRRNAFPGYSSNYYQSSDDYESIATGSSESFALTWEDTWVGGRFYFAIINSDSTNAATVTIASASQTVTSGGGSGTTDASTSTTGGAAEVVAPLFLIALLIAALL